MRLLSWVVLVGCADVDRPVGTPEFEVDRTEIIDVALQVERYVYEHLTTVEAELRAVPSANPLRVVAIDRLHGYREARIFPHNHHGTRVPTPVFIDIHGTRCAMAYLIEQTGATEFVQRIANTQNLARITDLATDPELISWLETNGITLDEAARIQPHYSDNLRCLWSKPVDIDAAPDMQAAVTGTIVEKADAGDVEQALVACDGGKTLPCYELKLDPRCDSSGYSISIDRRTTWLRGTARVEIAVEN